MTEKEVFWHNYRLLRARWPAMTEDERRGMRVIAKVGLFLAIPFTLALLAR